MFGYWVDSIPQPVFSNLLSIGCFNIDTESIMVICVCICNGLQECVIYVYLFWLLTLVQNSAEDIWLPSRPSAPVSRQSALHIWNIPLSCSGSGHANL